MRLLGLAPGIDSDSVTASCDLGVLRVVMPIEQPAVRKDPPEAACFLTLTASRSSPGHSALRLLRSWRAL
ncbi:Hsp20/alpha crystallin family protein [Ornithinibacter aureus]|uniref:Hsp20/alpha crystallin family protein n=1 Tax=Ornithinibacter aureus TaxID=622664 RepID=UPI003CCD2417